MKTANFQNSKVWGDGAPTSNATTIRYTNLKGLHVMTNCKKFCCNTTL
jgi:hypothetical protein